MLELYALIVMLTGLAMPLLALIAVLAFIPLYYFIYATPYIIVLDDLGIVDAIRNSVILAKSSTYLVYTIAYMAVIFVLAPFFSFITVNGKIFGIIVMSVIAGPLGLWLSASTAAMVATLRASSRESLRYNGTTSDVSDV